MALQASNFPTTKPELTLDFANSRCLDPRITFTRASTGTYVDERGILQTAPVNVARFDHNPTTGESLGLLVEEQRTNLLTYSEDVSQWASPFNTTLTANSITAPDNALTADRLLETTATNLHTCDGTALAFVTSTVYTYSVFVKPIGDRNFEIAFPVTLFTARFARFTLSGTGSVQGVDSGVTASIQALANGWYRCSATSTCAAGASSRIGNFINDASNSRSYTGDITKGIYIWGAQLEAGAFATSYIPTTTATATRSADVASITGTAFSGWYRQDEGTMFAQGSTSASASNPILFQVEDGTVNERMQIRRIGASNIASSIVTDGGVNQGGPAVAGFNADTIGKVGFSYALNNLQLAFNGALGTADTSATLPTVDRAFIGSASSPVYANGHISRITYWRQRLPNSTLQTLTSS